MAGKHSTENLTTRPSECCNLFPNIPKDANAWLSKISKSCKLEKAAEKDLEDKLEVLAIKQENDKPAKDIESLISVRLWEIYHTRRIKDLYRMFCIVVSCLLFDCKCKIKLYFMLMC